MDPGAKETKAVLVVAPEPCLPQILQQLEERGWDAEAVPALSQAAEVLRRRRFSVALLVLGTRDAHSPEDFQACVTLAPCCEWVGVFPPGEGARSPWREYILEHFFDHHTYPADLTFLYQSVGHAWGRAALRAQRRDSDAGSADLGMAGQGPAMHRLRAAIRNAAAVDAPVLVTGERGSGKQLAARALHACSTRASGRFVVVNCGALSPMLVRAELFGHDRGAGSPRSGLVEAAEGGTLFLQEIAELPLDAQAALLRVVQDRRMLRLGGHREIEVNTRVVAASHVDLAAAALAGHFRDDLYLRLNVLNLSVPPLRDRKEDIPTLARQAYQRSVARTTTVARGFQSSAIEAMLAHDWPGNVRELFNRVQRAVVMTDKSLIRPEDLGLAGAAAPPPENLEATRIAAEKNAIQASLERVSHNVTLAARDLGVSRMTLYRLMAKHGMNTHSP